VAKNRIPDKKRQAFKQKLSLMGEKGINEFLNMVYF